MKKVRVANGQGFWGDCIEAPTKLIKYGNIDYLTLDYLAEVTMSIMQRQKKKDPENEQRCRLVSITGHIKHVLGLS